MINLCFRLDFFVCFTVLSLSTSYCPEKSFHEQQVFGLVKFSVFCRYYRSVILYFLLWLQTGIDPAQLLTARKSQLKYAKRDTGENKTANHSCSQKKQAVVLLVWFFFFFSSEYIWSVTLSVKSSYPLHRYLAWVTCCARLFTSEVSSVGIFICINNLCLQD